MGEPVDTSAEAVERVATDLKSWAQHDDYHGHAKRADALLRAMSGELQSLRAQCARVQRYARRYEWLRDEDNGWIVEPRDPPIHGPDTFNLDAAIDAAMAAKGDDWLTREARQIGLHSPACASVRFGQNECDCGAAMAAKEAG